MKVINRLGEQVVFSYAHYSIKDPDKVFKFFKDAKREGVFVIDKQNTGELSGAFVRNYPKNHRNPLSRIMGSKQVIGGAEIKENKLVVDVKTKSALVELRNLLENKLCQAITFERESFNYPLRW